MKYHYPRHYRQFQCIGAGCKDSCCTGWQIGIDLKTYLAYGRVPGAWGRELRNHIDHKHQTFHMKDGRCAFLNASGLCDIYGTLGKDMLCHTCRTYPRHVEDFGDLQELTLSLSCPEAAAIILTDREQGEFLKKETLKRGVPLKDAELLQALQKIRDTMAGIILKKDIPWEVRVAMMLTFAHDAQRRLDAKEGEWKKSLRDLISRYEAEDACQRFLEKILPYRKKEAESMVRKNAILRQMCALEPVTNQWKRGLTKACKILYHTGGLKAYQEGNRNFAEVEKDLEAGFENLILYILHTYVLGAVYDNDVYSKGKLAVYTYLILRESCLSVYLEKETITVEDLVALSYTYSREIENSYKNLEQIEQWMETHTLFHLNSMLTALLGA